MLAIFFVISGVLLRLAPHIPNFTPITAAALFGGVYLNKRSALFIPLLTLAVSDYLLLYINPYNTPMVNFHIIYPLSAMFHSTTLYVWGSFTISGLIGLWLRKHNKPTYIIVASLFASLQFFLITNFGVWAGGYYGRGIDGLVQSYLMGLPFYRYTLLGDLLYATLLFSLYNIFIRIPIWNTVISDGE